jgi:hypothetical protein
VNTLYLIIHTYNAVEELKKTLLIAKHFEKVMIIDGAWAHYPHKSIKSNDGTKELCQKMCGDKLIYIDQEKPWGPWPYLDSKWNVALAKTPKNKFMLFMGADESLFGDIDYMIKSVESGKLNYYDIPCINFNKYFNGFGINISREQYESGNWKKGESSAKVFRIYRNLPGIKHTSMDSFLLNGKTMRPDKTLDDMVLINRKYESTYDRYICGCVFRAIYKPILQGRIGIPTWNKIVKRLQDDGYEFELVRK